MLYFNPMTPKKLLLLPLLLLLLASCSALREIPPTPDPTQIEVSLVRLTPDQIAQAMQADQFYANYNGMTLSVQATVAGVSQQNGDWMMELKSTTTIKVLCDLGKAATSIQIGDAVTVQAFTKDVQRQGASIVLANCQQK
jgi:hypothetical protein